MQLRLATTTAKKSNWLGLLSGAGDGAPCSLRRVAYVSTNTGGATTESNDNTHVNTQEEIDEYVRPQKASKEAEGRKSVHRTCPRLESTEVSPQPPQPNAQQKRRYSGARGSGLLEEVSCAGLDGTPWPDEKEQEDDNKEYFRNRKASPLSEIEVADTRKPLTRATDGTAHEDDFRGGPVMSFRPEQVDSAEEALLRASRIWKERAMRGDPHFPPSKVLRDLRRENF